MGGTYQLLEFRSSIRLGLPSCGCPTNLWIVFVEVSSTRICCHVSSWMPTLDLLHTLRGWFYQTLLCVAVSSLQLRYLDEDSAFLRLLLFPFRFPEVPYVFGDYSRSDRNQSWTFSKMHEKAFSKLFHISDTLNIPTKTWSYLDDWRTWELFGWIREYHRSRARVLSGDVGECRKGIGIVRGKGYYRQFARTHQGERPEHRPLSSQSNENFLLAGNILR